MLRHAYYWRMSESGDLTIAVVPSRLGKGFGHELMTGLLEKARRAGYDALSLSVAKDSPAVSLYERYGLRAEGGRGDVCEARRPGRQAAARPGRGERLEGRGREADDERRRVALQGERRRVGQGHGALQGRERDRRRGRRGRELQVGDR